MKSHNSSLTVQAPSWAQLRAVCLCIGCARLSSTAQVSSQPVHIPMLQCWFLAHLLFSFPVAGGVWRLQSRDVFTLLVSRTSSSGFCSWKCFSFLLIPESFLSYVAPWIYNPLDTTFQYNSVTTSSTGSSSPRSFHFSEVTAIGASHLAPQISVHFLSLLISRSPSLCEPSYSPVYGISETRIISKFH